MPETMSGRGLRSISSHARGNMAKESSSKGGVRSAEKKRGRFRIGWLLGT